MTRFLYAYQIRVFDYPEFAMVLRERVREAAASLAAEAGIAIEHVAKGHIRKEAIVAQVLEQRGEHPGLVHVISAMEACDAYKPWHDKQTHKTYLRPDSGKCLHYYFYFMDAELGLVYLRVPTWSPFRLQFYCNGHSWLARQLTAAGIGFISADNAFVRIDDWHRAQELADGFSPDLLHRVNPCLFASRPCCGAKWRDCYAAQCCPVLEVFGQTYHWSLMQVEYATDLVFRSAATLEPLYEQRLNSTRSRPASGPPACCNRPPVTRPPRSMASNPKPLISSRMNSFGSESSPETKITRRPPFFAGPSLKRSVTIELNAFTIRAPGAKAATTSLAPLSPRSASTSWGLYSLNGFVASISTRPFHAGRPRSASSTFGQGTASRT
jgi:hypothetical protein